MKDTRANRINVIVGIALVLCIVHLLGIFLEGDLQYYGIYPRNLDRWHHIFTAPFIHGDWMHLANNLLGLVVFGLLCMLRSLKYFVQASLFIITVTGFLVWAFARPAVHIGASGWVFGLWSLLIISAWYDRRFSNIIIAIFVVVFYGGMIYGIFPNQKGISYESHLFGAISGILFAAIKKRSK